MNAGNILETITLINTKCMCASTRVVLQFLAKKKKQNRLYNENDVGGRVIQVSPPITILSLACNCTLNCTNKAGGKTVMRTYEDET